MSASSDGSPRTRMRMQPSDQRTPTRAEWLSNIACRRAHARQGAQGTPSNNPRPSSRSLGAPAGAGPGELRESSAVVGRHLLADSDRCSRTQPLGCRISDVRVGAVASPIAVARLAKVGLVEAGESRHALKQVCALVLGDELLVLRGGEGRPANAPTLCQCPCAGDGGLQIDRDRRAAAECQLFAAGSASAGIRGSRMKAPEVCHEFWPSAFQSTVERSWPHCLNRKSMSEVKAEIFM